MRKFILWIALMLSFMLALSDVSVWATNASQVIGVGPISRSMGGAGIANPQSGVSAIYMNPATLPGLTRMQGYKGMRAEFGASLFQPFVTGGTTGSERKSADNLFAIPAIGLVLPTGSGTAVGFAAVGLGGNGTDYRNNGSSRTLLLQIDFIPAFGIELMNGMLAFGISFPVTWQVLDMGINPSAATTRSGASSAMGISTKIGVLLDLKAFKIGAYGKLTLLKPNHSNVLNAGLGAGPQPLKIEPPAELGIGFSFVAVKNLVLNLDAKYILWNSAEGYGSSGTTVNYTAFGLGNQTVAFNWENQIVIAFGAQYRLHKMFVARLGYNFGNDALRGYNGNRAFDGGNLVAAPAITKHHITGGFGIDVDKNIQFNVGVVYAPKVTKTVVQSAAFGGASNTASNEQLSIDLGIAAKY